MIIIARLLAILFFVDTVISAVLYAVYGDFRVREYFGFLMVRIPQIIIVLFGLIVLHCVVEKISPNVAKTGSWFVVLLIIGYFLILLVPIVMLPIREAGFWHKLIGVHTSFQAYYFVLLPYVLSSLLVIFLKFKYAQRWWGVH